MKNFIVTIVLFSIASVPAAFASRNYVENSRVRRALDSISAFGETSGVGEKSESCLLCHSSSSGGANNINGSFGSDFRDAAIRLGYFEEGANLPATGPESIASIFEDSTFQGIDSDGDGESNAAEIIANTDPADDVSEPAGDDDSSGCGMVATQTPGIPPSAGLIGLLLTIPLLLIARLRRPLVESRRKLAA